ncbi:cation diffusion facilitator family transporter [uncultured Butyricimonas sp.]|uniref:cation diffusion facilitator family transporter n=1 Tax=uncultured Butyricimonas sp. TaxID=1268785 RepID=UPI0026DC9A2D|nr:cation diffusion facilitator family transporter [uncultured Butyricimonas sp.]
MKNEHSHEGHSHAGHNHSHGDSTKNLGIAFFLNLGFAVIEIIGGVWTNSVAIISDAVHDFGDAFSIGVSFFLERYSKKRRTRTFTYGYKRFSTLGALINSIVLLVGSVFVFMETIPRLFHPAEVNYSGMMWLAIAGLAVNGFAALRLMKGNSISQRAVMLHLLEDVLGWLAVLVGSLVIRYTGWYFIDPLLSVCIGIFILTNVCRNLYAIFRILLQATPEHIPEDKVKLVLEGVPGVKEVHDLHVWTLDGEKNIASAHLIVPDVASREDVIKVKHEAVDKLKEMGIDHLTVEIEYESEGCYSCPDE